MLLMQLDLSKLSRSFVLSLIWKKLSKRKLKKFQNSLKIIKLFSPICSEVTEEDREEGV